MNLFAISFCTLIFLVVFHLKPMPAHLHSTFSKNTINFKIKLMSVTQVMRTFFLTLTTQTSFLPIYYRRNDLIWLDGFLFDFLQKKSVDVWLRKFVINTGYIFSERMVFDQVVRVYLDNIIWPLHYVGSLETENVSEMLSVTVFLYFFFIALLSLLFILI